jgi:tetrahydrodipicolinate N-succinyltransferase
MGLVSKVLGVLKKTSPHYPKGMNSEVDSISELVVIGKNFISAPGSILLSHDASLITHTGKTRVEKTVIEDDVFVGANAVVLPGTHIGKGSIIGAGAVVSKTIPPYSVVAGNPARVIMSVQEYVKKCEDRNVLYDLPESTLKKHGSGIRYTPEEAKEAHDFVMKQYRQRNP